MARNKRWTEDNLLFLKEKGSDHTTKELMEILGRSRSAIYAKNLVVRRLTTYSQYGGSKTINDRLELPPPELAYIAGIIDGEGTVSFEIRRAHRGKYFLALPVLRITNTHKGLIDWIVERLKPTKVVHSNPKNPLWKICYHAEVQGFKAMPLLRAVLPYMIVKRKQAELLLKYFELRMKDTVMSSLTNEELQIVEEVRKLNQKGRTLINSDV